MLAEIFDHVGRELAGNSKELRAILKAPFTAASYIGDARGAEAILSAPSLAPR